MSKIGFDGGLTCALKVRDLDKAIAWYRDVLGFQLLYKLDEMAWAEMASPVARVNVGLGAADTVETAGGATLTWGVKDIDRARADLEKQRVKFDGDTMTIEGMVKLATFFDPDGNKFMLFQDIAQAAGAPR